MPQKKPHARKAKKPEEPLLSVEEAAARLVTSPQTVRAWLKDGTLVGLRSGPRWRVPLENVEAFIKGPPARKVSSSKRRRTKGKK